MNNRHPVLTFLSAISEAQAAMDKVYAIAQEALAMDMRLNLEDQTYLDRMAERLIRKAQICHHAVTSIGSLESSYPQYEENVPSYLYPPEEHDVFEPVQDDEDAVEDE